jgi:uncharacterized protein YjbJ (UPF0337 family)
LCCARRTRGRFIERNAARGRLERKRLESRASERTHNRSARKRPKGDQMTISGKKEQIKGRVKEATGVLTGDKKLEREGKVDRAAGNIKEKAGELVNDVKKTTEKVVDKVKSTFER